MKLYTEEQVRETWNKAYLQGMSVNRLVVLPIDLEEHLESQTPIELPSIEEIEKAALKQFPYPIDIKDKNDEIVKTRGEKPFNHAKIEKYRTAFTIGAKYICSKIKGDK